MDSWDYLDEMPYRKKTVKKPVTKIDHKHDWEQVLVYNPGEAHLLSFTGRQYNYRVAPRCTICGIIIPGGLRYAKQDDWFYPVSHDEPPILGLANRYDVYVIDKPTIWATKDSTYTLFKRKKLDNT